MRKTKKLVICLCVSVLMTILCAAALMTELALPAEALTSSDVVYYGNYPQSGNPTGFTDEPILWRVLEVSGDKTALMLSERILDAMSFNAYGNNTDPVYSWWSESQIRKFLNGKEYVGSVSADVTGITVKNPKIYSFYKKAFSAGEGSGIIKANVDNLSTMSGTPGPNTTDKIFLLSIADAFNSAYGFKDDIQADPSRKAEHTDYGALQGVTSLTEGDKKYGSWWLRSPSASGTVLYLTSYGAVNPNPTNVMSTGLRSAFRLNLQSLLFTSPADGGKKAGVTTELQGQVYKTYTHEPSSRDFTEHKLTLATDTYKLDSAEYSGTISAGTNINITYSGASTGVGYHLAAVVTSGDRALYYGQIKSLETEADAAGTATFVIPEYNEGEEVYVFVEGRNNNGDGKTDFASKPQCISGNGREIAALPNVEEPRPGTEEMKVNPSALTIFVGYDKLLSVTFAPDGAKEEVTWSSSDPTVAAVDSTTGIVSALKVGSATITATAKTSNKTAECKVTVTTASQGQSHSGGGGSSGCNAGIPGIVTLLTLGSLIYIRSRNGK